MLDHLGPEPLSTEFSGAYLYERSRRRQISVKQFVMDGKVVVGVGNIYANEALFMAGIHPARAAGRVALKRYESRVETIKLVLRDAIEQVVRLCEILWVVMGRRDIAQQLGIRSPCQPCRACKSVLREIRQSGRSTVFCPAANADLSGRSTPRRDSDSSRPH